MAIRAAIVEGLRVVRTQAFPEALRSYEFSRVRAETKTAGDGSSGLGLGENEFSVLSTRAPSPESRAPNPVP